MAGKLSDTDMVTLVLTRAATRIAKEGRWKQRCLARTKGGTKVPSLAPKAVGWSLRGAIHFELEQKKMSQSREDKVYPLIFDALEQAHKTRTGWAGWEDWHDARGRKASEVCRLVDRACAMAIQLDKEREAA